MCLAGALPGVGAQALAPPYFRLLASLLRISLLASFPVLLGAQLPGFGGGGFGSGCLLGGSGVLPHPGPASTLGVPASAPPLTGWSGVGLGNVDEARQGMMDMGVVSSLGGLNSAVGRTGAGAELGSSLVRGPGDPPTLHRAFNYADIASHLVEKPTDRTLQDCRAVCIATPLCAAWEVCAPLGDGCDGCYLVKRAPRRFAERPGWHAEILDGREGLGWESAASDTNMTYEACHQFLLEANGADQNQPFHEPAILQRYTACGKVVRDAELSRQVFVNGQHSPTMLVTNFWDPPVQIPDEVEREMLASSGRQRQPQAPDIGGGITSELHSAVGTSPWSEHIREKPRGPHAFLLPFYDTNIGHWIKQHGSMNPLQSYEMQSLLRTGDVAIDVGANLGCYTVPFAERVGQLGKVLAFEPFRWLHQMVTANVAINGLSNVWVFPVGLGTGISRFEARPPQLRFFSSPGGVKMQNQQDGMKREDAMQLYDWDLPPELVTVVSLDELLVTQSANTALLGVPPVDSVRLLKIDVEGMEKEVIAGGKTMIRHFKPIIWTENVAYFSSNGQDTSFLQLMDELEYACAQAQNAPNDVVCSDRLGRGHQIHQ